MWTTDRTLAATIQPRPVRIAYLIPESAQDELLDSIVSESLSRWGGRRTPVIPTNGTSISDGYWTLLDNWDPDIIYSYVDLSNELSNRLFYSFAPSEIINHSEANNIQTHTPIFNGNYRFLSSLSLLPILDRTNQQMDAVLPEVPDNDTWSNDDRDFTDSFGLLSHSCIGTLVHPHARRLSIKRDGACRQSHEGETTYLQSVDDWIREVTQRPSVITLAALADMLSPYFNYWSDYKHGWDEHLTIVIGDSLNDRLLAWNGQHRYTTLNPYSLPILRLSPHRFENGAPEWLKEWILHRNHRCLGNTNTKQVKLKSCSLTKDDLLKIEQQLKAGYLFLSSEHFPDPNVFDLPELNPDSAIWRYPTARNETIRFERSRFEVALCRPVHLDKTTQNPANSDGIWAVQITIDRAEDHSTADGRHHVWTFPRRLRMETTLGIENYAVDTGRRIGHIVPPCLRPSKNGDLIIWDSPTWTRPIISPPGDYEAFCKVLRELPPNHPKVRKDIRDGKAANNPFFNWRVNRIAISDKGRDLLGVLQFFRSLPEALFFLTNDFCCRIINDMLPEQAEDKKKYVKEISKLIQDLSQQPEVESSSERIAKRALELASRSFNSQSMKILDFDSILRAAKETTKQEEYPGNQLKEALISSITYLRNREFLWQGFYWKCSVCEHENWVSLENLTPRCQCQICRTAKSSPVTGSFHFRLNPFAQHAFASTSAQGPVLWCLNRLLHQAEMTIGNRTSLGFAPALNIYKDNDSQPWTDIDVTANVNGLIVMVEVKRSFSGVNAELADQLFMLGDMYHPNIIMLAVQALLPEDENILAPFKELKTRLKAIDVDFALWTESDRAAGLLDSIGIPLPLGKDMTWSGW
jgi:hypothetical protein